jgi:hypothetical protein
VCPTQLDFAAQFVRLDLELAAAVSNTESYPIHLFNSLILGWLIVATYYFADSQLFEVHNSEVVRVFLQVCRSHMLAPIAF